MRSDEVYELGNIIGNKPDNVDRIGKLAAAERVLAAGYIKTAGPTPRRLGYIVVDRGGIMVGNQHKYLESAQAFADEWTADCKSAGMDWDYRVAEIFEATP